MAEKKQIDIAQLLLNHLLKTYTTEQCFSAPDLYHVMKDHGKIARTTTNNTLRKLISACCVIKTDEVIYNKHGGSDIPLYKITGKTSRHYNKTADHYAAIALRNQYLTECQLNLQGILNNIAQRASSHA